MDASVCVFARAEPYCGPSGKLVSGFSSCGAEKEQQARWPGTLLRLLIDLISRCPPGGASSYCPIIYHSRCKLTAISLRGLLTHYARNGHHHLLSLCLSFASFQYPAASKRQSLRCKEIIHQPYYSRPCLPALHVTVIDDRWACDQSAKSASIYTV